ncbi:MAG: DUF6231 family protein [Gammaproteobacteria bacterium]
MSENSPEIISDPVKQLGQLISQFSSNADSILFIADKTDQINFDQKRTTLITLNQISEGQFPKLKLFDFVLIKDLFEKMDEQKAESIIAQMRDVYARELLLIISESCFRHASDLISLGLGKVAEFEQKGQLHQTWYFAIESYKRVPDWLNNRYWANPELYEKYRW